MFQSQYHRKNHSLPKDKVHSSFCPSDKSDFSEAGISEAVESVIEPEDPYVTIFGKIITNFLALIISVVSDENMGDHLEPCHKSDQLSSSVENTARRVRTHASLYD